MRPLFMLKMVLVTGFVLSGPTELWHNHLPLHDMLDLEDSHGHHVSRRAGCVPVFTVARARLGPWAVICGPGLK